MKFEIRYQEEYSRGELLLRTFFGFFYIIIPHLFLLYFLGIAAGVLQFISFWAILFTGKYPKDFFDFRVKLYRWILRLQARLLNLSDGYPAFGLNVEDENTELIIEYPEEISRGNTILKALFGWIYILIPHGFVLLFRFLIAGFMRFIAFWVVLFTGEWPESFHRFHVETLRWAMRVNLAMSWMTDEYPPFSGKPDSEIKGDGAILDQID